MEVGRRDGRKEPSSVMVELEGTLVRDTDPFPYFMLIAFETSGLLRFALLLLLWPAFRALDLLGLRRIGLRIMVFVAVVAVRESEVKMTARAVLPKFFMDDVDMAAWSAFSSFERRVVVTSWPRVMVEHFARHHLGADEVVGCELDVNRFGYATGLVKSAETSVAARVARNFAGEKVNFGLARQESKLSFTSFCKEAYHIPIPTAGHKDGNGLSRPRPVIFHDGRLVQRPTPFMALLIILWIPLGVLLAVLRMALGLMVPLWFFPYLVRPLGGELIVRGRIPARVSGSTNGVLFVCTHRTLMDPVVLSVVLGRRVPAVTYSISRLTEILSPIRTVRLSRDRRVDAECIKSELAKGDLVVCPEGTTCREPFLLRFSALFAELTDCIVPVAINYHVGFFHATTARGWKAMDPIFFFMNPKPAYELTFLNQLPAEATCTSGKSPNDVANYVQKILAATLGFECTNFTRKDKYRVLTGNDGTVSALKAATPWVAWVEDALGFLLHQKRCSEEFLRT